MKERPILFSGAMVRALLDGSKTQTRRVVKPQPGPEWAPVVGRYHPTVIDCAGEEQPGAEIFGASDEQEGRKCPYGQPGDRLWVRETWAPHPDFPETVRRGVYRADSECKYDVARWRPSIHMPCWASRIVLEITGVRVERLRSISPDDAVDEGIERVRHLDDRVCYWRDYLTGGKVAAQVGSYRSLWESINGAGSWEANPWVWVLDFKRMIP